MEYSSEQLNYFRMCHIAVKLLPEGLRKIFKQEWDFRYSTTSYGPWLDTARNGNDFHYEETKRKKTTMNGRFLNIIHNGNSSEWDCSCLFSVFLVSNAIGSTLGPVIRGAVDDLRLVRNDVAHITNDELKHAEFQAYVTRVLNAFTSLGLPVRAIEDVTNQSGFPTEEVKNLKKRIVDLKTELDQVKSDLDATTNTLQRTQVENKVLTQEINSKIESFSSLPFMPPHDIIRRSSDIKRITNKMQELYDGSNGKVSTIYLSGNPGCGKSQLARQIGDDFYNLKSRDSDTGLTFVATLNAKSLETLADSYVALAKRLGITEYAITEMEKSKPFNPVDTLKKAMSMIPSKVAKFESWLIIVDGVVDLRMVRSYLPQTASNEWGRGQLLITTQDSTAIPSNAPLTYHESLSQGMQQDDAMELLKRVSQISDQQHVEVVAEVLEYQPLSLAAAAYFVQSIVSGGSPNFSWKDYLKILRQGQLEATEETLAAQNPAYSETMTSAVKMALQRAMDTNDVIRQTFLFLSMCASESIAVDIVVDFVAASANGHTIKELIKADILKSSLLVKDECSTFIRLHNIVHDALTAANIFDSDSQRHHCIATAINVFETHLKECLSTAGYGNVQLRKVASHSRVFCDIAFPNINNTIVTSSIDPEKVISCIRYTAKACWFLSQLKHASRFCEIVCDLIKNDASTEIESSKVKSKIFKLRGYVAFDMDDFKPALFYHKEALKINRTIYGEEHLKVARSYNFMARIHDAMRQHDMAKELYSKAQVICEKNTAKKMQEHKHAAKNYHTLAVAYWKLGKYEQAIECDKKALNIKEKVHGKEHSDVAKSYHNLAINYSNIGKYEQAIECGNKALNINEKVHGKEHGHVALSYHNLAACYTNIGKNEQAIECDIKALNIREKIHGKEHSDVAKSYHNLGVNYGNIGKYEQAIECHKKALNISEKIHGQEHGDVADSYYNLAGDYSSIGKYEQAIECDIKALNIREKIHGEEHGDVARSYYSLAVDYSNIGTNEQAIECDTKALNIREKIHGKEHGDVAGSYHNLADDYRNIGKHEQAIECDIKALNIRKKIHGEEHGDVAWSYHDLAGDYRNIGKHEQAIECDIKALNIREKIHGQEHGDVARSYHNLGVDYGTIGKHEQAIECDKKALNIREKIHGEEHGDVADSYYNLAVEYRIIGKHEQAIQFDIKALNIREKIHGEEHGDVARSYYNLSVDYRNIGTYEQAIECDIKALNIREKIYGQEHGDVARSYYNLAVDYRNIGKYEQAIECDIKALNIREKIYGQGHGDVAGSYHNLAGDYRNIGKHEQAIECDIKALNIREKIHGQEHGDVARSYHNLGVDYGNIGKHEQAIECDIKALNIREKIHGQEHGDVARSYHNLGVDYGNIGKHEQAIECDIKALNIREKIHGKEHGDVAKSYHNLAVDYRNIGKYEQAKECYKKALNIRKKMEVSAKLT